jgi:hypothetical protein
MKIANKKASEYIEKMQEFKGSNLFSKWLNENVYVVYSHGEHWPLLAWIDGMWYQNIQIINASTSRHLNNCYINKAKILTDVNIMRKLIKDSI